MNEYGVGLKDFLHNYTVPQIRILSNKIEQRKRTDLRKLLAILHPKDPVAMDKLLSESPKSYNIKEIDKLSDLQKSKFNIKKVNKPKE